MPLSFIKTYNIILIRKSEPIYCRHSFGERRLDYLRSSRCFYADLHISKTMIINKKTIVILDFINISPFIL